MILSDAVDTYAWPDHFSNEISIEIGYFVVGYFKMCPVSLKVDVFAKIAFFENACQKVKVVVRTAFLYSTNPSSNLAYFLG